MDQQEQLDKIQALQDQLFELYQNSESRIIFCAGLLAWEATRLFWYAVKGDKAEMNNKYELVRRALDSFLRHARID